MKTNAARILDSMGISHALRTVRGGVTALGAKKDYPVYADETIALFDVVSVSAGARGIQILIAPADYLRAVKGMVGPIATEAR